MNNGLINKLKEQNRKLIDEVDDLSFDNELLRKEIKALKELNEELTEDINNITGGRWWIQ